MPPPQCSVLASITFESPEPSTPSVLGYSRISASRSPPLKRACASAVCVRGMMSVGPMSGSTSCNATNATTIAAPSPSRYGKSECSGWRCEPGSEMSAASSYSLPCVGVGVGRGWHTHQDLCARLWHGCGGSVAYSASPPSVCTTSGLTVSRSSASASRTGGARSSWRSYLPQRTAQLNLKCLVKLGCALWHVARCLTSSA